MKHFYTRHPFRRKKQQHVTLVLSVGYGRTSSIAEAETCPRANYRKDCGVAVSGELNKTNSCQNYTSIANESYFVESNRERGT